MLAGPATLRAEHRDTEAFENLLAELPVLELPIRQRDRVPQSSRSKMQLGLMLLGSISLHLLLAVLLGGLLQLGRSPPPRKSIKAVLISSSVSEGAQQVQHEPTPPAPEQKTQNAAPTPKPLPQKSTVKPAQPASAAASTSPAAKDQAGIEADEDSDSLLSRLRANWLAPPRSAPVFRCRLRIDYRLGGMIAAVVVQQGCGDPLLADSIERAVWKTQPLKLESGAPASGSIELEFSP